MKVSTIATTYRGDRPTNSSDGKTDKPPSADFNCIHRHTDSNHNECGGNTSYNDLVEMSASGNSIIGVQAPTQPAVTGRGLATVETPRSPATTWPPPPDRDIGAVPCMLPASSST